MTCMRANASHVWVHIAICIPVVFTISCKSEMPIQFILPDGFRNDVYFFCFEFGRRSYVVRRDQKGGYSLSFKAKGEGLFFWDVFVRTSPLLKFIPLLASRASFCEQKKIKINELDCLFVWLFLKRDCQWSHAVER